MISSRIKIERRESSSTHFIGSQSSGELFLFLIEAYLGKRVPGENWRAKKRWYLSCHRFSPEGEHLGSNISFMGCTADGEDRVIQDARDLRERMLKQMEPYSFGDISVKLFSVQFDGVLFGLVDSSDSEEEIERVELIPANLAFFPPWNGEYES